MIYDAARALDGPRAQVKLFPFLHGPQERPSRRGSRLLAFGRVPIILLGSGPFFSYFIFVFSLWFVSNGSVGWKESRRLLLQNEKKPCLRYFFRILPVKSCHSDHFRRYFFVRRYYRLCLIYMNGRLLLSSTGRWWWLVNQCPTLVRWGKPKSNGEKKFFLKRKKKILKASPLSLFLSFSLLLWWRFSTM